MKFNIFMKKIFIILFSFFFLLVDSFSLAENSLKIVINEILPSPSGPDDEGEWIEISNPNNFEVDISDWKIQDTVGKTKTYTFPKETKILAQGFLVLKRPVSKITLNNDGDGLKIIDAEGKIVDEVSYQKAKEGKSFAKTESGWLWTENLTPGAPNTSQTSLPESKPDSKAEGEAPSASTPLETADEKGLAAVGESVREVQDEQIPESHSPLPIAILIAIFSGAIILILKKKIEPKNEENIE